MKKLTKVFSMITLLVALIIVLGACGKNAKDEFNAQFDNIAKKSSVSNTVSFGMKINSLDFSKELKENASSAMIASQLKGVNFNGEVQTDKKNKLFVASFEVNAMTLKIPIKLIGDETKQYLSTDFLTSSLEFAKSFGANIPVKESDLLALKGRYINLNETAKELAPKKEVSPEVTKNAQAYGKAYQKELKKYMEQLDKKDFTKDGNEVSYTFTKGDLRALINLSQKVAKSDKKFADFVYDKADDEIFDAFEKFDMTVTIDTKTGAIKAIYALKFKDSQVTGVNFEVNIQFKDKKVEIKLPTKKDILSQEEVSNILGQGMSTNKFKDESTSLDEIIFTDEEIDSLIEELKASDNKEELLKIYKAYLSEEQYKKIEDSLKSAI